MLAFLASVSLFLWGAARGSKKARAWLFIAVGIVLLIGALRDSANDPLGIYQFLRSFQLPGQ
jgi:hypothetical protein